jgi:hypothetical protein
MVTVRMTSAEGVRTPDRIADLRPALDDDAEAGLAQIGGGEGIRPGVIGGGFGVKAGEIDGGLGPKRVAPSDTPPFTPLPFVAGRSLAAGRFVRPFEDFAEVFFIDVPSLCCGRWGQPTWRD